MAGKQGPAACLGKKILAFCTACGYVICLMCAKTLWVDYLKGYGVQQVGSCLHGMATNLFLGAFAPARSARSPRPPGSANTNGCERRCGPGFAERAGMMCWSRSKIAMVLSTSSINP